MTDSARSATSVVHRGEPFTTPDKLKAEALELGSTMTYEAAEYIEALHRMQAKNLVLIERLRRAARECGHGQENMEEGCALCEIASES